MIQTLPVSVVYPNGQAVPIYVGKGSRANVASTATPSAATAIPDSANVIVIRSTENCYIAFGDDSVSATSDADSILFVRGEVVYPVSTGVTHFSVVRVGTDGVVQVEKLV